MGPSPSTPLDDIARNKRAVRLLLSLSFLVPFFVALTIPLSVRGLRQLPRAEPADALWPEAKRAAMLREVKSIFWAGIVAIPLLYGVMAAMVLSQPPLRRMVWEFFVGLR